MYYSRPDPQTHHLPVLEDYDLLFLPQFTPLADCPVYFARGPIGRRAYPVQRAPALCGVWGRVSVASLTLACAMRGDRDSNPGPSGHRR